jgi:holliday junction DNA helicase RuvA
MIGHLKGKIIYIDEKSLILEAGVSDESKNSGGVGYELLLPLSFLLKLKINDIISVPVHTHVREDQITLFAFENISEKELFRKLTSVSGVGPKSALTMLSIATPNNIIRAIESGSADNFPKTPGIGKKTLEKVILDLKGKFDNIIIENESEDMKNTKMALETLGYNARDISQTLSTLHPELNMSDLIKEALKILSKK